MHYGDALRCVTTVRYVGVLRQCVMVRYGGMLRCVTVHYFDALGCYIGVLRQCVTAVRYGALR